MPSIYHRNVRYGGSEEYRGSRLVAYAGGNRTFGEQILFLYSYFAGLTEREKERSYLVSNGKKYSVMAMGGAFGCFTAVVDGTPRLIYELFQMWDGKYYAADNAGASLVDQSTSINADNLYLYTLTLDD